MQIGLLIGGVLAVLAAIGAGVAILSFKNGKRNGVTMGAIIAVIFVISLVLVPSSFHTVQSGEIAVVKVLGEAKHVSALSWPTHHSKPTRHPRAAAGNLPNRCSTRMIGQRICSWQICQGTRRSWRR